MDHLYNFNLGHLILSPSIYDVEKFKGFVPFIINWIFEKKTISFYSISEEYGENDHYHLDIIIFSKSDINKNILNNKGKQIGLSGHLREFVTNNLPNTKMNPKTGHPFYCYESEHKNNSSEYNKRFMIGYNFKEGKKNWNNLEISSDEIKDSIQFYEANETKQKKIIDQDVIQLNSKNAMFEMKKYLKNQENPQYHQLVTETIKKGYCWLQMSKSQTRKLILQLKLIRDHIEDHEEDELNEDTFKNFDDKELESMKMIRQYNCPPEERIKYLYENNFITKTEYNLLIKNIK